MRTVQTVMSKKVIKVRSDTLIFDAIAPMVDHSVSVVFVVDHGGKLVGVVTEPDVLKALLVAEADQQTVVDYMSKNVMTCHPDDDLLSAAQTLAKHQIGSLPVINNDEKLVGLIRLSDITRYARYIRAELKKIGKL